MYRTVIIGLGEIAAYHTPGLRHAALFEVVATSDINPAAPSRGLWDDVPFYTDYSVMLREQKPDIAIVATPPATHREIVMELRQSGVFALVEKPLTNSRQQTISLLPYLKTDFDMIYHWMFAQEVVWFKRCIRLGRTKSIRIAISDPNADPQGHIYPQKQALGGTWIDSGVNALSMLSLWLNLSKIDSLQVHHQIDDLSHLPYHTEVHTEVAGVEVDINISWNKGVNQKHTYIETEDALYHIDHTQQSVSRQQHGRETLLFSDDSMPRLSRHYYNFYSLYPASLITRETTQNIHRLLFQAI